jgi:hypothetical protein
MTNRPTIEENKRERLNDCVEKLDRAFGDLLDTLENQEFDDQLWDIIDDLLRVCNLRIDDVKDELK